jgi:hypothetical protein
MESERSETALLISFIVATVQIGAGLAVVCVVGVAPHGFPKMLLAFAVCSCLATPVISRAIAPRMIRAPAPLAPRYERAKRGSSRGAWNFRNMRDEIGRTRHR